MNKSMRMILVLAIVGLISGASLALVYNYATPQIKANQKKELELAIFEVFPEGKKYEKLGIANNKQALEIIADLSGAVYKIVKITKKEKKQKPHPPFTTSTLQQEAWQKLSFSAQRTMRIAQQLYEGINLGKDEHEGLITYMRTDSLNVAVSARKEANSKS